MGLVQSCSDGTRSTSLSTTKSTTKQLPWNLANAAKLIISNQLTIISHSNNNSITQRKKKQMVRFVDAQLLSVPNINNTNQKSSLLDDGDAGACSVTMMNVRPREVDDHSGDLVTKKSPSSPPPPSRHRLQTTRRFGFNSSYLSQSSKDELSRSDDDRNARRWYGRSNDNNEIVTDNMTTSLPTIHSIEKSNNNASKRYPISIKIPFQSKSRVIQNQYDLTKTTTSTSSESSVTSYSLSEDHPFSKEEELKQMYDLRTWDMYLRITAARRYQREQETQQQQELQRRHEQQQQMDYSTTTTNQQQQNYQPQLAANFRQNRCDRNNMTTASHTQSYSSDNNAANNTTLTANPSTNTHQSYYHDDEAMMMMCYNQYLNNNIHVENTATTATSTTTPVSASCYYNNNLTLTPSHNNNKSSSNINNISNNNLDYDHYDEHELIFGDIE